MRIGLSAPFLIDEYAGLEVYTAELVRGLAELDLGNEYYIFVNRGNRSLSLDASPNFHIIGLAAPVRLRFGWEQVSPTLRRHFSKLDLLHCPAGVAPLFGNTPTVVTVPDFTFKLFPQTMGWRSRWYFRLLLPLSARRARRVIVWSQSTKKDALRLLGLPEEKLSVIPIGVDVVRRFVPEGTPGEGEYIRAKYGIPGPFVLYCGTLEPRKNPGRLIQAYGRLRRAGETDRMLVLVGKRWGAYRGLVRQVHKLGLDGQVLFRPPLAHTAEDLPRLYRAADLFVYPSLYEGFGIPPVEAMACGTPVVASTAASLPEVVGEAGILVDPYDVEGLAEAMARALSDKQLRHRLAEKGLQQARQFSRERMAEETLALYRQLLG